ncbi:MAG TPA: tryptophan 7-halogenase [Vicinamibacterales bacterium]
MSKPVDVLVIGGGPAGATAAGLLASWGRSVALIHHESSKPSLAESLPASTRKLLRFLGQLEEVDTAGFHPNHGNISRWAGREARAESADAGYHVSRSVFDRLLRNHARAQGASIVEGQVQRVDVAGDGAHTTAATLECTTARGVSRYRASFVLDCSGRAGIIARRGLRRADAGYRTLAIAAEWECPDWPSHEQTHTIVDSYENGWAWSVPLSATRRQCTVMVDAGLMTVRKASLDAIYCGELRKARSIDARLTGSRQINRPWACDASLYTCLRAADSAALLVGDAASFIEPLSSAGVKKALASAWRAAVVLNTALDKPQMLAVATDYHDRREREVYQECLRRSAEFFKTAANVHEDEFWSVRASVVPGTAGAAGREGSALHDARVRAAFDILRDASSLELTPAPHLRFEPFAVIEDREVVLRDAIVLPGTSEPVRYVGGVNLPELIRIAAGCRDVPSLIESYHHRVAPVDPRDLLVGLSVLVACGVMRNEIPLES